MYFGWRSFRLSTPTRSTRALVAQALEDGLTLATGDRALRAYPIDVAR